MKCPVNYVGIKRGYSLGHKGIDFGWNKNYGGANQPIYACEEGIVVYYQYQGANSGGYVVGIYHPKYDMTSEYGHLKKGSIVVKKGDKVSMGQMIAKMGCTGNADGCHLHFGLQKGKGLKYGILAKWVDPIKYLNIYNGQTANEETAKKINHTKIVTAKDGLNVRTKPNTKGKIVYTAKYNSQVENHGLKSGWNIVDNILGYYCSNNYLK